MAPAAQFIDTPVVVPESQSVEQAENYVAHFPILLGRGQIDSQTALGLNPDGYGQNWNDCRKNTTFPAKRENIDDMSFMQALVARMMFEQAIDQKTGLRFRLLERRPYGIPPGNRSPP